MFDSHAHYDDKRFDIDRDETLQYLFLAGGVDNIINVGCDLQSSYDSVALAEKYEQIYAVVGFHPHDAKVANDSDLEKIEKLLSHKKVVALGEIGLDYHYDFSPRDIQKAVFRRQLAIAQRVKIPVVIHEREAHGDCLDIINEFPDVKGVYHSYSGSVETAKELFKKGWYISVSGVVTFSNAQNPVEVSRAAQIDRLLVETDTPYLTPHPFRGQRNDSGYLKYTIEKIASIRGMSFEELEKITADNAKRCFGIE